MMGEIANACGSPFTLDDELEQKLRFWLNYYVSELDDSENG